MRKLLTLFTVLLISVFAFAQNPKLSYQAVVRDGQNKLVVEQPVTVTVNVLDAANASQFAQTLNATTNRNGLMSLEIGDETDAWNNINWVGAKIRTAVALSDGTEFVDTNAVNAVPFALYANNVSTAAIPQSDWAETDNSKCTFILNKPSIADTVNNILTTGNYVTTATMDARGYLTADSALITTMQGNITTNAINIVTNASNIATAVSKEQADSTTLAERIDALEGAAINCNDVKECMKDTLSKYITATAFDSLFNKLKDLIETQNATIDSLQNVINSLTPSGEIILRTEDATNVEISTATLNGTIMDDGDIPIETRGFCWNTSENPTLNDNHSNNGIGIGSFSHTINELQPNTTYYVRIYAINSNDTIYGEQKYFTTKNIQLSCEDLFVITDFDGNEYHPLQLGSQCWLKENMHTTHYADGTAINLGTSSSTTTKYRCYPNGDANNVETYGYLYNWAAAMNGEMSSYDEPSGIQGVCPSGWHVPSSAEWNTLKEYVRSQSVFCCHNKSSYIAKALASPTGWTTNTSSSASDLCSVGYNPENNNMTGFSAVPAGSFTSNYNYFSLYSIFWSTTQLSFDKAVVDEVFCYDADIPVRTWDTKYFCSVRCLKN